MGFLIFLGILIAGAAAIVVVAQSVRPRGPIVPIVYLGAPASYTEQVMWMEALRSAGIHAHIENPQPSQMRYLPWENQAIYNTEVWVRQEDYEGARAVLGLDHAGKDMRTKRARLRKQPHRQV
ncbi:MAG TPA: hypothetical protein VMT90_06160 [Dehalococcoidia bacterium]|jgi:hypothetical protein|nr:hypothetical protein [Dehalococcoidia bacterium]